MPEDRIREAVREVLGSMTGDITAREAVLVAELGSLGQMVRAAKAEIAAMRVQDINASHIPAATDELDAVVQNTAEATNEILDVCEALERLQPKLADAEAEIVGVCVTRIYEACSFQDITGQRIGKVVNALKAIEERVAAATGRYAAAADLPARSVPARTEGEKLASGPQLPGSASSQAEIDALLASFD